MRKIKLVEVRSEIAAGTRGASLGVDALKIASLDKKSNFFSQFEPISVPDANNFLWKGNKHPYANYIDGVYQVVKNVYSTIESLRLEKKFPIVLAGDHSTAAGTIMGIKGAHPDKRLGVIWIDAHADLHTPYTTPSGNLHGMPMAISLGEDNPDCASHTVDPQTVKYWDNLKRIGKIHPKVKPEDVIFIALRDYEKEEKYLIEKLGMKVISTKEVRSKGIESVVRSSLRYLADCTDIYVSFDVDSLDASISRGTGTPVSHGLKEREAEDLISKFMMNHKICCLEITEVNPTLDRENLMAEIAFNILQRSVNILLMN